MLMTTTVVSQYVPQPQPLPMAATTLYTIPQAQQTVVVEQQPQPPQHSQSQIFYTPQHSQSQTFYTPEQTTLIQQPIQHSQSVSYVSPATVNYDQVPTIDNNTYMLYSGMLYGNNNNMVVGEQVIPAIQAQNYPNM